MSPERRINRVRQNLPSEQEAAIQPPAASANVRHNSFCRRTEIHRPVYALEVPALSPSTFVSIADTGAWPAGSTIVTDFNAFDAKGNSYEGLRVSLHILQPGGLPTDELSGQRVALTSATVGYLPLVELFFRKDLK